MKHSIFFLLSGVCLFLACQAPKEQAPVILFENGTGEYNCYRIPAIVKAPDGSLLAFAEGRLENCGDFGNVDILLRRSEDGGKNWSKMEIVADFGALQAGNPAPVVDYFDPDYPQGRIFLFYNTGDVSEQDMRLGKGTREVHYITSVDQGKTWSKPTNITEEVHFNTTTTKGHLDWRTHASTPGHALQFKRGAYQGRIYIPANHSIGEPQDGFNEYRAYGFYSDDHGKTWSVSPDIDVPSSNEAIGTELPNGDLMLNIREQNGKTKQRLVALSSDGGTSWKETYFDPSLISPVCQSSILLFEQKNQSLLIYSGPNSTDKREKMTLKFSLDDGKSWAKEKEVYAGGAAYSDLVQVDEEQVGLFYEKDFKQLVYQVFTPKAILLE
jgi:sialidase-1